MNRKQRDSNRANADWLRFDAKPPFNAIMTVREIWHKWHRARRVMLREHLKACKDMMLFGTGVVIIPSDGTDPHCASPEDFFKEKRDE